MADFPAPAPLAHNPADAVLSLARALGEAVNAARDAGYIVTMPFPLESLNRIVLSETGRVKALPLPAEDRDEDGPTAGV